MRKSVIEYLRQTVLHYPDKIAVNDTTEEITFKALYHNGHILATEILSHGIRNKPVGVYIPKGCKAIQAFAGINISGNFYVPMDTKSPDSRVLSIINVLNSAVIITDKEHYAKLAAICSVKILVIEDVIAAGVADYDKCEQAQSIQIDTDPVYSIFTSGSTGTPKGVVISHRGVLDYIDWAIDTFHIDSTSVIGNQAPLYFDNSTLDIYLMYATGSTLVIIPEQNFMFPAMLVDFLNEYKITFVFWVPFVLVNVANFDIFASKKPLYLKDVFFAGEVMPNKHLNYWRKHLPHCRYANLYGPTEITVDCTYYLVDRTFEDNEPLPIGIPCRNSDILILTDDNRIAAVEEQGELCVRGTSLALGYYNDWEKTQKAFVQNPLNTHYPEIIYRTGDVVYLNKRGEIMYVGRKDSQIKHNGYRIELGEIETAVLSSELVDNCCAVYDYNRRKILLFYQSKSELDMVLFRKNVLKQIPKYMIPSEYYRVDSLKLNSNGKLDRLFYNEKVNTT
ncbi:amino acid adenylation domain-containing protein [Bacteroides luti]|uniref:Amino acid adenylation domain-containing protein n=1 Tax=Bacteroides luti TaxID=1297750 RepID=A0A1M4WL21_9BACE|nr:amino acid adenylation domain-containing protein [Bacteroides luti]SHE81662.1 amino acid adenylation domain-containing protein [Bacteroides luti]